jgi:CRISPR-associated protein Cas1
MNAVLGFLYALLRTDCDAAIQGVGLDPQIGYLHALRPGRPALALIEELRAVMVDRLALTLINRRQRSYRILWSARAVPCTWPTRLADE